MKIRLAHSPDADDAFMFYALATGKVDTGGLVIEHVLEDIQTLNEKALRGEYEVTALSYHAYAYVSDRYLVTAAGSSMGDGYGPIIVARRPLETFAALPIAVPGKLTTAYLLLRLFEPKSRTRVVPFDRIAEEVARGAVRAGVLIHEGQLAYGDYGLVKLVDLGAWWKHCTGLPVPLGANAVRRDLGPQVAAEVSRLIRESVSYALAHREEALAYAANFARGLPRELIDRFVGMYVNELTLDLGARGRQAVHHLFTWAHQRGLIPLDRGSDPPVVEGEAGLR